MKFRGFYRLSPHTPSPVIAMFSQREDVYVQGSEDGATLDKFIKIIDYEKKRIFVVDELKINPPKIGEKLIYAYEYAKGSVAIGTLESIKTRLVNILSQGVIFTSSEFAQLEVAQFTENADLLKHAAASCFQKLNKQSPLLSHKWLQGAALDEDIKAWVVKNFSDDHVLKTRSKGFRISCLRAIINCIDEIAVKKNFDRNKFLEYCIMHTKQSLGDKIRYEFFHEQYRKIDFTINNIHSGIYRDYIEARKNIIRQILNNESVNNVPNFILVEEAYTSIGLYQMRPSIRISGKEAAILKDVFRNGPRLSERAKCAFLLFCVQHTQPDFFELIDKRISDSVALQENPINGYLIDIYRSISVKITNMDIANTEG